jgi:hypothetical protein
MLQGEGLRKRLHQGKRVVQQTTERRLRSFRGQLARRQALTEPHRHRPAMVASCLNLEEQAAWLAAEWAAQTHADLSCSIARGTSENQRGAVAN